VTSRAIVLSALMILSQCVTGILAGDLDPPGLPQPTAGPEPRIAVNAENTPGDANSVFQIVGAGSYYLTGNVNVGSGLNGIEIISSDVTLDLNGFTVLRGRFPSNDPPTLDGIVVMDGLEGVTIRGGSISRMGGAGLRGNAVISIRVENLNVSLCGSGVNAGPGALVSGCSSIGNDSTGFNIFGDSIIERCLARDNGTSGILLNGNGIIARDNVCSSNGVAGIAFNAGTFGSCAEDNLVRGNSTGFSILGTGHVIARNTAVGNTAGYVASGGNAVGPVVGAAGSTNPWANFQF